MALNLSTESIARASSRRPWITIGVWVVVFLISVFLRATVFDDVITTEFAITNDPESNVGKELIEEKLTGPKGTNEVVIIQSLIASELTVDDPEFQQIVNAIHADVAALGPEIIRPETLLNYFQTPAEFLVSQDRRTMIMPFTMAGDIDDASDHIEEVADVVDRHKGDPNFKVLMVGQATVGLDFQEVAQEGLLKGEVFGVPIALIILVLVLGAIVAAVIPLILKDPYHKDQFTYNEPSDSFTCPQGQTLKFIRIQHTNGVPLRLYRASEAVCQVCPAFGVCTRAKEIGRSLAIGPHDAVLRRHRAWMSTSAAREAYKLRKQLVEPVFGIIKEQQGARRFLLRGLVNVATEWTMLATAFNLRTLWRVWRSSPFIGLFNGPEPCPVS